MKRVGWPIYVMAVSVIVTLGVLSFAINENRQHQQDIAQGIKERNASLNEFLRTEVCERLELRDEIQLSYLRFVLGTLENTGQFYRVLEDAIFALEVTQKGCFAEIPKGG
jgi:hypothetical protein